MAVKRDASSAIGRSRWNMHFCSTNWASLNKKKAPRSGGGSLKSRRRGLPKIKMLLLGQTHLRQQGAINGRRRVGGGQASGAAQAGVHSLERKLTIAAANQQGGF